MRLDSQSVLRRSFYAAEQLLLALVVTPDGNPLVHFLFPGNRTEKPAMLEMLVELRQRYRLQRRMVVGDRGLPSTTGRLSQGLALLDEAMAAAAMSGKCVRGRRFDAGSRAMRVDALVRLADLRVRQGRLDDAADSWRAAKVTLTPSGRWPNSSWLGAGRR